MSNTKEKMKHLPINLFLSLGSFGISFSAFLNKPKFKIYKEMKDLEDIEKNSDQTKHSTTTDGKPVLVAVTPEMIKFAEEYSLWIVTAGQDYINALSPKFTTESSMKIFIDNYYSKDWLQRRFKLPANKINYGTTKRMGFLSRY